MNVRDSEAVGAMLEAAGHVRAEGEADADVIIVNSCTVRQKAEEKAVGKCGNLNAMKDRPRIVGLMGCAVKRLGADVTDCHQTSLPFLFQNRIALFMGSGDPAKSKYRRI